MHGGERERAIWPRHQLSCHPHSDSHATLMKHCHLTRAWALKVREGLVMANIRGMGLENGWGAHRCPWNQAPITTRKVKVSKATGTNTDEASMEKRL